MLQILKTRTKEGDKTIKITGKNHIIKGVVLHKEEEAGTTDGILIG